MISEYTFTVQLQNIFSAIASESVCIHSAIAPLCFFPKRPSKSEGLNAYLNLILSCSQDKTLLFPTFNYDFCVDGVYDVINSPSQVGVLNECARLTSSASRTQTPVFNFVILRNHDFALSPVVNVFGAGSTFERLAELKSTILFIGPTLKANTFVHHVEEVMNIGYRYPKVFSGHIRQTPDSAVPISISYRVRPLEADVSKDWPRLTDELYQKGLLQTYPLGSSIAYSYQADKVLNYWCDCLSKDELFFLKSESRVNAVKLYEKYGSPLSQSRIEAL